MDNLTPPIQGQTLMNFGDALQELVKGKKIARVEWHNTDYGFLKDGIVAIYKNGEVFNTWMISDGDITATDWVVLPESN